MKKVLSVILLAGMFAGTVYAEEASLSSVSAMAQEASGASLDALSMAVYELVKAQPSQAVEVFQSVMQQRQTWSVTETYAILRSVLLAAPSLESGFVQSAATYQSSSAGTGLTSSQGYQLLSSLYTMPQTQAVAQGLGHILLHGQDLVHRGLDLFNFPLGAGAENFIE